jgi:hypothetical protein
MCACLATNLETNVSGPLEHGVQDFSAKRQLKPHKVRYYLERRDDEFEQEMAGGSVRFIAKARS